MEIGHHCRHLANEVGWCGSGHALHLGIPIHAEDTVLDQAAVTNIVIRGESDERAQAEQVESSASSYDSASPEDFDTDWFIQVPFEIQ